MFGEAGIISNIRSRMNPTAILVIVVVLLLLGVSVYYYTNYISKGSGMSFSDNSTNDAVIAEGIDATGDAELIMFHVDWCPHCKTAKPEWDKVVEKYDGKSINGYNVAFTDMNCTEETPEVQEMMEMYKVEGDPTIKLIKGDQVIDFEAKPTEATLTQFLTTVLN